MSVNKPIIAVVGGTGALGSGLAGRWISAGYAVIIGSRDGERARIAADQLGKERGSAAVRGMTNSQAAAAAELIVVTVPFANHGAIIDDIADAAQGKILVDATVPLVPPKVSRVQLPPGGSVGKAVQENLGPGVRVVSAFQSVAASHLADDHPIAGDVLVCGNNVDARAQVITLVEALGLNGWHAGPIDNAVVSESMTSVLIFLNGRYKMDGAGIRITGEPRAEDA